MQRGDSKSKGLSFLEQSAPDVMLRLELLPGPYIKLFAFSCVHVSPSPLGVKCSIVEQNVTGEGSSIRSWLCWFLRHDPGLLKDD